MGGGGDREVGENGEEAEGVRFPYSPRAEVVCGGRATVAGGGGRLWPWRRCCRLGEEGARWGAGSWRWRAARRPTYRRGKAVERGGAGGRARRPLMVVWPRRGVAERRRDSRWHRDDETARATASGALGTVGTWGAWCEAGKARSGEVGRCAAGVTAQDFK